MKNSKNTNKFNDKKPSSNGKDKPSRNRGKRYKKEDSGYSTGGTKTYRLDGIKSNDISWYNKSQLYPLVTRIPFAQIAGGTTQKEIMRGDNEVVRSVPGIMTIDFAPTIGWAADMNSAVNRAFNKLYASVVAKTTGALQSQQMDIAILTTGLCSIATHIGYAKRAMATYQMYSDVNYYWPQNIVTAMGFSFEDLKNNAARYQYVLTDLIGRFNRIAVPDVSSVYKRQYALAHNLYSDGNSVINQLYNFRPAWIYNFKDEDHSLRAVRVFDTGEAWTTMTLGAYLGLIEGALKKWENSSVTPIVSGNILRAFPDSKLVKIDPFDINARVQPEVDRNILWQINNMRWARVPTPSLDVIQVPDENILKCQPAWGFPIDARLAGDYNRFKLNSFDGDTSPEFQMEATRLIPTVGFTEQANYPDLPENEMFIWYKLQNCPSELVSCVTLFTNLYNASSGNFTLSATQIEYSDNVLNFSASDNAGSVGAQIGYMLNTMNDLVQWSITPPVTVDFKLSEPNVSLTQEPFSVRELQLFTFITQDQLEQLHYAAAQSLYALEDVSV